MTVGAALQVMLANTRLQPVVMGDGAVVLTTERPKPGATQEPSEGATAQTRGTAAFEGRVIRPDGTPAAGASIDVLGSSDSAATTDSGRFVLHNLAPGSHTLLIRQMGFRPALVSITMTDVQSNTLSITLVRAVPVLPTVVTTSDVQAAYQSAGLSQRMRAGLGQFLTYDQIEQRQARKLSELLEVACAESKYSNTREGSKRLWAALAARGAASHSWSMACPRTCAIARTRSAQTPTGRCRQHDRSVGCRRDRGYIAQQKDQPAWKAAATPVTMPDPGQLFATGVRQPLGTLPISAPSDASWS